MSRLNKVTFALRFLPLLPIGGLIWCGCYTVPTWAVYELAFAVLWAIVAGNPWAVLSRWLSPLSRAVLSSGLLLAYAGYKCYFCTPLVRCVLLTLGAGFCVIAYMKRKEWLGVFAVFQSWRVDEVINVFTYAVENDALEAWENGGCGELRAVLRQSLHVNLSEESLTYSHKAAFLLGYLRGADIELQANVNYYQGQIDQLERRAQTAEAEAEQARKEANKRVKDVQSRYSYMEEQYKRDSAENSVLRDKVRLYEHPDDVSWEEYWGCQKTMDELMLEKGWVRVRKDEPAPAPVAPVSDLMQGISAEAYKLAGWKSWETMTAEAEEQTTKPVKLYLVPQQDEEPEEIEEELEPDEDEEDAEEVEEITVEEDRPTWSTIAERNELIRQYYNGGEHTHPQTARYFGISESLSKKVVNAR